MLFDHGHDNDAGFPVIVIVFVILRRDGSAGRRTNAGADHSTFPSADLGTDRSADGTANRATQGGVASQLTGNGVFGERAARDQHERM
jgi:hypothetical protein